MNVRSESETGVGSPPLMCFRDPPSITSSVESQTGVSFNLGRHEIYPFTTVSLNPSHSLGKTSVIATTVVIRRGSCHQRSRVIDVK